MYLQKVNLMGYELCFNEMLHKEVGERFNIMIF